MLCGLCVCVCVCGGGVSLSASFSSSVCLFYLPSLASSSFSHILYLCILIFLYRLPEQRPSLAPMTDTVPPPLQPRGLIMSWMIKLTLCRTKLWLVLVCVCVCVFVCVCVVLCTVVFWFSPFSVSVSVCFLCAWLKNSCVSMYVCMCVLFVTLALHWHMLFGRFRGIAENGRRTSETRKRGRLEVGIWTIAGRETASACVSVSVCSLFFLLFVVVL